MISCFICFVILALPVPTLIQVYVRGSETAFSHGRSSKNGLWLHLGVILGRSCAHVGLTPPHDNTQQRAKSFFLGPPTQKHHFQTRLSAPRWPQDGPEMAQHGSRWPHDGPSSLIGFMLSGAFVREVSQQTLSRMFNDTSSNIQLHTTPRTTTPQHTSTHKVIF